MNLSKFLAEIDKDSRLMSKEQLITFVHEIARTLPERERTNFLKCLHGTLNGDGKMKQSAGEKEKKDIHNTSKRVMAQLEKIENEELCLDSYLNEEYNDWYDGASDEFRIEDPNGVAAVLQSAADFLHQSIDCEEYALGYEVAKRLVYLQIKVEGDYEEYVDEPLEIDELEDYSIGNLDYKDIILDALYLTYFANALPERADALYNMLVDSGRNDITLEMVMQRDEELPEINDFLRLWVEYLGGLKSKTAERLIQEALELLGDSDALLENARKYCGTHPALYEQCIRENIQKEDGNFLEIGREALGAINVKYLIRSRIALMLSEAVLKKGMQQEAEEFWLEALRSDTSVVNYMRLCMECVDFGEAKGKIEKICRPLCARAKNGTAVTSYSDYARTGGTPNELQENWVNETTVYMLAFFEGEFQHVREKGMGQKAALGWSSTFMKCGLSAFLLLLAGDGELQPGGRCMCRRLVEETEFHVAEYQKGTLKKIKETDEDWFWKCFCRWRKEVVISEAEKKEYLGWMGKLIAKRTKGIMEENRRNYYGECAEYIAALGEAKEALGEIGAKQKTLLGYKEFYSRRRAFHEALRAVGMRDGKK